jgi:phospholipid/cholesterol/gamma-HCH transport system substrate-binding protein
VSNVPRAGAPPTPAPDPAAASAPGRTGTGSTDQPAATVAGLDPATGLVLGPDGQPLQFGDTGGQYQFSGDQSWKQLLFAGLSA